MKSQSRPGRKAGDVYADIDYRSSIAGPSYDKPQQEGTYLSIELNTATPLPEWDGQKVYMMNEDDAYLTQEGYKTFLPLQSAIYLIQPK